MAMAMAVTTTLHPFDASRVLTPMVTGQLPDSKPIMARGQVYCGNDFQLRAVAWFLAEKQKLANKEEATVRAPPKADAAKAKRTTVPTRVQPPRAAKRKADSPPAQPPKKKLKIVLTKMPAAVTHTPAAAAASYTLAAVYHTATADQFLAGLATVLDRKRAALASGCHWSTSLYPSPWPTPSLTPSPPSRSGHSTPRSLWCPIVAEPLACIDRAYCLHAIGRLPAEAHSSTPSAVSAGSLGRALGSRGTPAPEAAMSPPCTPPPEIVLRARAKEFAEMRHVQERTVEFAGLRFAVDICDGSMRVWMV